MPQALMNGPFTIADARREGLNRWHLEGTSWKRLGLGTYVWAGLEEGPMCHLAAARRRLPPQAAFSGLTAVWLHGIDVSPCDPIEVTVPREVALYTRSGMRIYRRALAPSEVCVVRGMPATNMVRAIADLCERLSLTEAVVVADAALHARRVTMAELGVWVDSHAGRAGNRRLRSVIRFAEPATESPMETRLRMLLILAGLPRPKVQVPIHDREGRFVGRPDLYYEDARLGIEYDGSGHRSMMAEDNRRQNKLLNAGVRLLRFTAVDVIQNPALLVHQVRAELACAPHLLMDSLRSGTAPR